MGTLSAVILPLNPPAPPKKSEYQFVHDEAFDDDEYIDDWGAGGGKASSGGGGGVTIQQSSSNPISSSSSRKRSLSTTSSSSAALPPLAPGRTSSTSKRTSITLGKFNNNINSSGDSAAVGDAGSGALRKNIIDRYKMMQISLQEVGGGGRGGGGGMESFLVKKRIR